MRDVGPADGYDPPKAGTDANVGTGVPTVESIEAERKRVTVEFVLDSLTKTADAIRSGSMPVEAFFMGVVSDINEDEPKLDYTLCGAGRLEMLGILHEFIKEI